MRKFEFFSDNGHGWLKVPKALIAELGIANKISHFSYERSAYVYLEEDCDAELFAIAYAPTERLNLTEVRSERSRVRSYNQYTPQCVTQYLNLTSDK